MVFDASPGKTETFLGFAHFHRAKLQNAWVLPGEAPKTVPNSKNPRSLPHVLPPAASSSSSLRTGARRSDPYAYSHAHGGCVYLARSPGKAGPRGPRAHARARARTDPRDGNADAPGGARMILYILLRAPSGVAPNADPVPPRPWAVGRRWLFPAPRPTEEHPCDRARATRCTA